MARAQDGKPLAPIDRAVSAALASGPVVGGWRGRDPIWNGLVIGALVGGAAFGLGAYAAGDSGYCDCAQVAVIGVAKRQKGLAVQLRF